MFKYLIFLILIIFIENKYSKEEIDYFISVNDKVKNTQISFELEEKVDDLKEPPYQLRVTPLKEQIKSNGFKLMKNDKLKIKIQESDKKAIESIKKHMNNNVIRKNGNKELIELFTQKITYDIHQWNKYDLLVTQGGRINALSILTKEINSKFVTIYFTFLTN